MAHLAAYKVIQNDILGKIASGEFRPGTQIPTEADFMRQYDVSRITVQRALNELKQQGVLLRKPRAGTFVRPGATNISAFPTPGSMPFENTGRVKLGVVAPFDMMASGNYQYLNGVMKVLNPTRDSVSLHSTGYSETCERAMLENCIQDGCSGIMYYPGRGNAVPMDLVIQIEKRGIPCVLIDKQLAGINLPCVQTDNEAGAFEATKLLIEQGHRNITCIMDHFSMSMNERFAGYYSAMQQAGLAHMGQMCYQLPERGQYKAVEEALEKILNDGVTAVFCAADLYAKMLLNVCQTRNIAVPDQLAIIGFDGNYPGEITSMLQPYADIGAEATRILLDWIIDDKVERKTTNFKATLLEGRTL